MYCKQDGACVLTCRGELVCIGSDSGIVLLLSSQWLQSCQNVQVPVSSKITYSPIENKNSES